MMTLTPFELDALALSVRVALWSVLLSLLPAIALAYVLARCRFMGKIVLDAIIHLPLVLPPVVVGYFLLLAFGRQGPIGGVLESAFGTIVAFRWTGAAIAAAVMGFPLMVRPIRLSIEAIDARLEDAAATLGARRARIFVSITLPLMLPGLVTGILLGFARSLGEFGATITFVSNIPGETQTLPLAIHTLLESPAGQEQAMRLSLLSVLIAMVALLVAEVAARKTTARMHGRHD
jgi:molybdate transport system permease protein